MEDVVIVGAGGLGRECSEWVEDVNRVSPVFRLVGFVDDDPRKHGAVYHGISVVGDADWFAEHRAGAIVAIGAPEARRRIVANLARHGVTSPNLIHPRASIGRSVSIADGAIVGPGVVITADVTIGRFAVLNYNLTVGHDGTIDDYVTLAPGVHLSGFVKIGEGCDLGAGAVVLPGLEIGSWSIVGAGCVVTSSLPTSCTAVGVPARVIKTREPGWQLAAQRQGDA